MKTIISFKNNITKSSLRNNLNFIKSFTLSRSFSTKLSVPLPMKDLPLKEKDPELYDMIEKEKRRLWVGLELIASENYAGQAVLDCIGSVLTNKYSEGYPGARYYGGNEYIDQIEDLARVRTLKAFSLNPEEWGVNVQPYSGSPANLAAYTAILKPGDKLMGLDLYCGGHLTHGAQTETKKLSASSLYFESKSYKISEKTELIDYEELQRNVSDFKPKLLLVGGSAYPRDFDYAQFRKIADSVGAYLMADIAHISGLVATGEQSSPFTHCDLVTSTTHKSLRGPRAGIILFNKKRDPTIEEKINFAVFPMLQGGPHNHQIAAIASQMKEVSTPEFKLYSQQVRKNAKALAQYLLNKNHKLITGGTDNHLMLWDVRPLGLTGSKVEKACDLVHITVNKNTIIGDKSAIVPGGIRIGLPAITTRGMVEKDMNNVGEFLHRITELSVEAQKKAGKNLKQFIVAVEADPNLLKLKQEVEDFSTQFFIPGVDIKNMKYFK
jgi:glycine hydroxymethyltransferase